MSVQACKKRVLVVDDEPQILVSIKDILEDEFEVRTTTSPQEALGLLEKEEMAVLLSDQRMPSLTGDQLLRKARDVSQATRVLITGYMDLSALIRAVNQGQIFGYLAKPWDPVDLELMVRRAAEQYWLMQENQRMAGELKKINADLQMAYDELRQTQQAVMQHERLRALGQMAAGIVHDVNNSLSPILGYTELLLLGQEPFSNATKHRLDTIRTAAQDISQIVARMREFYRPREPDQKLLPVGLNRVADQVVELTRPRWKDMPEKRGLQIEIRKEFQADLPPVLGVESEIREALTNLILNAVDAMPQGGTITLRTSLYRRTNGLTRPEEAASVRTLSATVYAVVEIADTGTGMTEEVRRRCLEPFFSTKGERGTGLGLAMVFGVMQRHDGEIHVESQEGKGSAFRLLFPLTSREENSGRGQTTGTGRTRPLHVLYIDDEPLLRELVSEMLVEAGHRVELGDGGQAGLDLFERCRQAGMPFDVVITDLGMPGMNGRDVTRRVKILSPKTPVVLLTGWGSRSKIGGDLPSEVDVVLAKPPKVNELLQALAQLAL